MDIVLGAQNANTFAWFENDGTAGSFLYHSLSTASRTPVDAVITTMYGLPTIVTASLNEGTVRVYSNSAAAGTAASFSLGSIAMTRGANVSSRYVLKVTAADLNGDGAVDLALGTEYGVRLLWNTACRPGRYRCVAVSGSDPN